MRPSNKKLFGVLVLIAAAIASPMLLLFVAYIKGVWPLFDFVVGFAVGWFVRPMGLRVVCGLSIAPLGMVVSVLPSIFLRKTGEAAGWVLIALPYVFVYGLVISGVGFLLGLGARLIFVGRRREITDSHA